MNTPESLNGMVPDLIRRGLRADFATRAAAVTPAAITTYDELYLADC